MFTNPRKVHAPIPRDTREEKWMNGQPLSIKKRPLMEPGFVAPMGSLKGLDWWEAAIKKIERLTNQQERDAATHRVLIEQEKEMPLIVDEFRASGFDAISLSSSQKTTDDDEIESAVVAQHHLNTIPYGFGPKRDEDGNALYNPYGFPLYNSAEDLVPIQRRIEWEMIEARHSPVVRVQLIPAEDGSVSGSFTQEWMERLVDNRTLMRMIVRIAKKSGLDTAEALLNNRDRAEHYGVVGSILYGVTYGSSIPEQTMDDLGADDYIIPKKERHLLPELRTAAFKAQGERELGLHGDLSDELVAEMKDGILLVGFADHHAVTTTRWHDDPFSFDSLIWNDTKNGQPWISPS